MKTSTQAPVVLFDEEPTISPSPKFHKRLLKEALRRLEAIGSKYAVISGGETYGSLKIVLPTPEKPKKHARTGLDYKPLYAKKMNSLKIGCVAVIDVPDGFNVDFVRGTVASRACTMWGKGNSSTSRSGNIIEVCRLG